MVFNAAAASFFVPALAGSVFWVDPKEDMFVVFMINYMIMGPSMVYVSLIRDLVYQAMIK